MLAVTLPLPRTDSRGLGNTLSASILNNLTELVEAHSTRRLGEFVLKPTVKGQKGIRRSRVQGAASPHRSKDPPAASYQRCAGCGHRWGIVTIQQVEMDIVGKARPCVGRTAATSATILWTWTKRYSLSHHGVAHSATLRVSPGPSLRRANC